MYRTHGQNLGRALLEFFLLRLDAAAHAANHIGVLAAQAAQLGQLVIKIVAAHIDNALNLGLQLRHIGLHGRLQHLLATPHDAVGQQVFERWQTTGLQQRIIFAHLGHQTFLRRHRQYLVFRQAQKVGRVLLLTS